MRPSIRKSYVDCSFGQLHLTQASSEHPGDGRTLLLLNPRTRSILKLVAFLPEDYSALIVDIPGMGLSSPPTPGASMAHIAGAIAGALDALALDKVDLFGLHTGHKVAAAMAQHHANRVNRLMIAGKTHSIIPDSQARNKAMAAHVARRPADVALVTYEGRFVDDASQQEGFENIFKANYRFDFGAALRSVTAETLILEICSELEDGLYGRQGELLANSMPKARCICLDEKDVTGLDLYAGADRMGKAVSAFLE